MLYLLPSPWLLSSHLDYQAGGHDFTMLELLALFFLKTAPEHRTSWCKADTGAENILTLALCDKTLGRQADRETCRVPRVQYCSISYILIAVSKYLPRINLKEDTLQFITVKQPVATGSRVSRMTTLWWQERKEGYLLSFSRVAQEAEMGRTTTFRPVPQRSSSSSWVPPPRSSATFQNSATSWVRVFKHMSLWRTCHIHTLTRVI